MLSISKHNIVEMILYCLAVQNTLCPPSSISFLATPACVFLLNSPDARKEDRWSRSPDVNIYPDLINDRLITVYNY